MDDLSVKPLSDAELCEAMQQWECFQSVKGDRIPRLIAQARRALELEDGLKECPPFKGKEILITAQTEEIRELKAENARLREALKFYATKKNWIPSPDETSGVPPVWRKGEAWSRARAAIAKELGVKA